MKKDSRPFSVEAQETTTNTGNDTINMEALFMTQVNVPSSDRPQATKMWEWNNKKITYPILFFH
jgi:hypothetical protein